MFLQVNFPILMHTEISLTHVIGLAAGILYGAPTAGLGALIGIFIGHALRPIWPKRLAPNTPKIDRSLLNALFRVGMINIALAAGWAGSGFRSKVPDVQFYLDNPTPWLPALVFGLLFILIHSCLWLADVLLLTPESGSYFRKDWRNFLLMELSALPFTWFIILTYPVMNIGALFVAGILPLLLAILLYGLLDAGRALQHRIRELSTLNQVSEVLRSTLESGRIVGANLTNRSTACLGWIIFMLLFSMRMPEISGTTWVLTRRPPDLGTGARSPIVLTDRVIFHLKPLILSKRRAYRSGGYRSSPHQDTPQPDRRSLQRSDRLIGCCVFLANPQCEFSSGYSACWKSFRTDSVAL